jgi:hypothetical protein
MRVKCHWCGVEVDKNTGHYNRAKQEGRLLFCSKTCFGLNRRTSKEQKIEAKRLYDIEYRKKNLEKLKAKKEIYYKTEAGRAAQKRNRDKRKEAHKAYIKTASYKQWKYEYDQKYHAKNNYGEFWEASLVLKEIETVIEPEKLEVKIQKGTYNKSQKRKRLWNSMQRI